MRKIRELIETRLLSALFFGVSFFVSAAAADSFPDVKGIWAGSYKVAFPQGHATYSDLAVDTQMELEVYKQDGNLIWVINRWRRQGETDWISEYGTGSFDLEDREDLVIAERGPAPEEGVNTGGFIGEYEDEKLYLTYGGPGDGITFSVELSRKTK